MENEIEKAECRLGYLSEDGLCKTDEELCVGDKCSQFIKVQMSEMTAEKAKELFSKQIGCFSTECMAECGGCPNETDLDEFKGALQFAISALEKQIPKKVVENDETQCPNCNAKILTYYKITNYCLNCGQALKYEWVHTND